RVDRPRGRRRRPGSAADLQERHTAGGVDYLMVAELEQCPAGSGDRPAVGVDIPLPAVWRLRDDATRAAGQPAGAVQRHLARRHPLLLGLHARRQGRRQSRGERRRVRDAQHDGLLPGPVRRTVRHLARRHVRHRPGHVRGGLPSLDAGHRREDGERDQDPAAVRAHLRPDHDPGGQGQPGARPDQRRRRLLQPGRPGTAVGKERVTPMAIETQPESAQAPGGGEPGAIPRQRAWWLRPNILTAIVGAAIGYAIGHWLGNFMTPSFVATGGGAPDSNDEAIVLGYAFLILGWLIGLGVFNDLVRQMLGRTLNRNIAAFEGHQTTDGGIARYFRFTLDHKVVGLQYLVGMLIYFFTGGLLAIAIRTELLSPSYHVMSPTMYLQVVGEHGTMMMMMLTSVILGPFGNYLVPIMIGSKRVAFPRIEALSFWLTPCA